MGNIVLAVPLAPTGMTTLWNDEERFYKGYLLRFQGKWLDTGDAGMIDEDGYVSIMSRSDDILNVAAHRYVVHHNHEPATPIQAIKNLPNLPNFLDSARARSNKQ